MSMLRQYLVAVEAAAIVGFAVARPFPFCGICATDATEPKQQMPPALFAGVVASLSDSSKVIVKGLIGSDDAQLTIEARPLRSREIGLGEDAESALTLAGVPSVDSLSHPDFASRLVTIKSAGLERGEISIFERCPGDVVFPPGQTIPADEWNACPPRGTVVAALGLLAPSDTDARVEVLVLAAAPHRVAQISTFTMRQRNGKWHLVKQEPWIMVD
jgi:hypothetical protein